MEKKKDDKNKAKSLLFNSVFITFFLFYRISVFLLSPVFILKLCSCINRARVGFASKVRRGRDINKAAWKPNSEPSEQSTHFGNGTNRGEDSRSLIKLNSSPGTCVLLMGT